MKNFHRPFAETFKTFLPLKQYFVRNWQALAIGLLSLLIVDFLQLLIPLIIKRVFDLLTTKTAEIEVLLELGTAILVIALMISFFSIRVEAPYIGPLQKS